MHKKEQEIKVMKKSSKMKKKPLETKHSKEEMKEAAMHMEKYKR